MAQFGVVAATPILAGIVGRAVVGPAARTFGALLCAVYLPFLGYATRSLTEILACLGLTLVVALLLLARRCDRGLLGFAARRRQFVRDWPLWMGAAYLTTIQLVFSGD